MYGYSEIEISDFMREKSALLGWEKKKILSENLFGFSEKVFGFSEKVFGYYEKVYGYSEKVYGYSEKVYGYSEKIYGYSEIEISDFMTEKSALLGWATKKIKISQPKSVLFSLIKSEISISENPTTFSENPKTCSENPNTFSDNTYPFSEHPTTFSDRTKINYLSPKVYFLLS